MLVAANDSHEVHPQGVQSTGVLRRVELVRNLLKVNRGVKENEICQLRGNRSRGGGHLFVVSADEVEDEAAVHERQHVVQEEGQTAVQPLHQLHVLENKDLKKYESQRTRNTANKGCTRPAFSFYIQHCEQQVHANT